MWRRCPGFDHRHTCKDILEGFFNICWIQGWSLYERQIVLLCGVWNEKINCSKCRQDLTSCHTVYHFTYLQRPGPHLWARPWGGAGRSCCQPAWWRCYCLRGPSAPLTSAPRSHMSGVWRCHKLRAPPLPLCSICNSNGRTIFWVLHHVILLKLRFAASHSAKMMFYGEVPSHYSSL